jgi:general secretion pathway protein B
MSFILDALRKSEHDRQRQAGPALAEVPVAQPKSRSNVWATAAIALLLVNLVAIGVLLIRKAAEAPAGAAPAAATPTAAEPVASTAPSAPEQVSMTRTAPPMLQPARAQASAPSRNPLEDEVSTPPDADPELVARASAAPAGPPAVTGGRVKGGSVVYESLPDDSALGGPAYTPPAQAPANAAPQPNLPTADELAAAGGAPALNLDLHVYSTKPAERMAFINGHKYREGDTLQEGAVVRQITPNGVVLEMNGRQFLLARD